MAVKKVFHHIVTVALVQYARHFGITNQEISGILHLDPSDLDLSRIHVDPQKLLNLVHTINQRTNSRVSGLQLIDFTAFTDFGITAHILVNCKSITQFVRKLLQYHQLMGNVTHLTGKMENDRMILTWNTVQDIPVEIERIVMEYLVAVAMVRCHELTGRPLPLEAVEFNFPEPENTSAYVQIPDSKLSFDGNGTNICFNRSYLDVPLRAYNSELLSVFENHARECYDTLIGVTPLSEKVNRLLLSDITHSPGLTDVAGELGISPRTLQMRLKKEGTSFVNLRDQTRYQYAKQALQKKCYSATEIGIQLGFSEPSVFYQAFKRWSGKSTKQFLKEQ